MFKKVLFTVIAILFSVTIFAQNKLSGKVMSTNGNTPLKGAHVFIKNSYIKAFTDKNGEFIINDLKAGNYTIKITHIGFVDYVKELNITSDKELKINMEVSNILEEEVVIKANRPFENTGTSHQTLKQDELLEENPVHDLPYVLKHTPGVVVTSDAGNGVGYTNMRIRGTDVTRINFTINGIPLNDPESHGVFFVNMGDFTSSLNSIQIQRGVGSSTNGASAFGASVNMHTESFSQNPYAEVNTSYGSFNTQKYNMMASTGLIKDKFAFNVRLSKIYSDGFVDRAYTDLKSFYMSGAYYGKRTILRFIVSSGKEKTYQSWYGIPKDSLSTNRTYNYYEYDNETDNYQQDHYQLHYSKEFNSSFNINASAFLVRGKGYYENYKAGESYASYGLENPIIGNDTINSGDFIQQKWLDNYFYGLVFSANYDNNKNLKLKFGGSVNQYDGDHYGDIIWAQYATFENDYQWYFNNGLKTKANIYAKALYDLNGKLSAFGDIQLTSVNYIMDGLHDDFKDLTSEYYYMFFSPKAGMDYKLQDNSKLFFSFSVANREPSRSNFRDADESNSPKPETLIDYEFGYKLAKTNFAFVANAYYMDYKNQLVLTGKVNNVGAAIMTNVDESYRTGLELVFESRFTNWLETNTNASFSQNKINKFTAYIDDWDNWGSQKTEELGTTDISFSPNVILGNEFKFSPLDQFDISLVSKFVGRQYIDNTSSIERSLDPYFVNDLVLLYKFKVKSLKKLHLRFAVNNILNEEYETNAWVYRYISGGDKYVMDGYFPQAGINFMTGLSIRF